MNRLTKPFLIVTTAFLFLFAGTLSATAASDTNCAPIYGGGTSCQESKDFSVDLKIRNPQNNSYADSFNPQDVLFAPNQQIVYKLTIKNTSKKDLTKVPVTIFFPQLIPYTQGTGNYDSKNHSLTFTIDTLKPNDTKTFFLQATVAGQDKFPNNTQIQCGLTQALITLDKEVSQDNTQACINPLTIASAPMKGNPSTTKGGLALYQPTQVRTTPDTGPEVFGLISLLPMAGAGWYLRRKTS